MFSGFAATAPWDFTKNYGSTVDKVTGILKLAISLIVLSSALAFGFTPCSAYMEMYGESAGDKFGHAVANAGDINQDGVADFLVGAPYAEETGLVYLYSGATGALMVKYSGEHAGDLFGWSVAAAGDVDHDTYPDFIIGAPDYDNSRGRAYVYSGQKGDLLFMLTGHAEGDNFGYSVANAGKINSDENDDLIVGAIHADLVADNRGVAYIYSGADTSVIYTLSSESDTEFGFSVAGVEDVDKDGVDDFAVGQPSYAGGYGKLFIFSGMTGGLIGGYLGNYPGDAMGWCVAGVGDANNDGYRDVVSGSPFYDG